MKFFKYLTFFILFFQGVLVAGVIEHIQVKGVEIPILYEEDRALPIVSMQLVFQNSGSIEDKKLYGLAKFSSKILNEGTKKLGSVEFAKRLEDEAISLGVSCGVETMVFELSSLKEKFAFGVSMLSELLSDPNYSKESFEKVKILTLGSLSRKESDFDYLANLNLKLMQFKDTPLGHPFLGDKKSIDSLSIKKVKDFINQHIVLKRSIVIIGGDIELKEAKSLAKKALEVLDIGKSEELGYFGVDEHKKEKIIKKETKQAYIYFGSPFYLKVSDKDTYKAKVAAFILGAGGFGSRLMEEIRVKRGLAYSAYARINLNKSYSDFSGYLQTKTKSKDEAVKVVKEVIREFSQKGVSKEEFEQAKRFLLGSEPLRVETLNQRLSRMFLEYYRGYEIGYYKKELQKIEKLTLDELNSFIKKHQEINNLSFSIVTK
jgi:predicted Zn-dependent peptidase